MVLVNKIKGIKILNKQVHVHKCKKCGKKTPHLERGYHKHLSCLICDGYNEKEIEKICLKTL